MLELAEYYINQCAFVQLEKILSEHKDVALYSKAVQTLAAKGNLDLATQYFSQLSLIKESHDYKLEVHVIDALIALFKANSNIGNHHQAKLLIEKAFVLANNMASYSRSENKSKVIEVMIEFGHFIEVFNRLEYSQPDSFLSTILNLGRGLKKYNSTKLEGLHISIIEKVLLIYSWELTQILC